MGLNIKTQTPRSTKWVEGLTNANLFCGDFQFGITTSKSWGNFEPREEPLIELEMEGKNYQFPLSEFIAKIKQMLKKG